MHEFLENELVRAGFEMVDDAHSTERTLHLPLDHWIDVGALCMLTRSTEPTSLFDSRGDLVAWRGHKDPRQCTGKMVTEANCFRIRYAWDFLQLNEEVLDVMGLSDIRGEISQLAEVRGNLYLGNGSVVQPGCFIEGNVVIGENCVIGPNAYIHGNTSIADNCHIGHGVEVSNSVFYEHVTVGHNVYVGDSIVGNHALLGAGTVLSNKRHDGRNQRALIRGELIDTGRQELGAIIGDGVRTGVNTTVFPGRKIGNGRTTRPGALIEHDMM
ncbi:DapH/DapD/GlmU-related protein [Persicirhabdus sediminis]|uniref:DapH/DapD/GlmU-related protein n=1 Tax=Persicirhabdus sediminis TaxID=454144 RepID=UPI001F32CEDC|nr:DapH/DapD/GlmU-related protein [Persicirhabdus sediminis]